jgi:hypothetical protein
MTAFTLQVGRLRRIYRPMTQDMYDAGRATSFDIAQALYHHAEWWHAGQGSDLYAILSRSPYRPGPMATDISDRAYASEEAAAVYAVLCDGLVDPLDMEAYAAALYDAEAECSTV